MMADLGIDILVRSLNSLRSTFLGNGNTAIHALRASPNLNGMLRQSGIDYDDGVNDSVLLKVLAEHCLGQSLVLPQRQC